MLDYTYYVFTIENYATFLSKFHSDIDQRHISYYIRLLLYSKQDEFICVSLDKKPKYDDSPKLHIYEMYVCYIHDFQLYLFKGPDGLRIRADYTIENGLVFNDDAGNIPKYMKHLDEIVCYFFNNKKPVLLLATNYAGNRFSLPTPYVKLDEGGIIQ